MGMEFRPYYFAKEWIKAGHNVTILAADNSHLRKEAIVVNSKFDSRIIDGITYIFVKTPSYTGSGAKRVINMITFVLRSMLNIKFLSKQIKPDIVISSSTYTLDNYLSFRIAKKNKAKYIYEVHDLWPLSPMELGNYTKYNPFMMLLQHAENFAYKKCDAVVSMLPKTQEHMIEHGLNPEKWHYIPNGIVIEDWDSPLPIPEKLNQLIFDLKKENAYLVCYTGTIGISNAINYMIEAAHILKDYDDIYFIIIGDGNEKGDLLKLAGDNKHIIFQEAVPKKAIPSILKEMNVLCVGAIKSRLYKYGVSPNKLIDYMCAGRPIVQYIESGFDIVSDSKTGISTETENPHAIAKAILEIKAMSDIELKAIENNGMAYVMKNHEYKVLSASFIEIMEKIRDK